MPPTFRLILVSLFLYSCGDSSVAPVLQGTYQYTSFESTGIKIVEGWMALNPVNSSQFTGEWHFQQLTAVEAIGLQVGDGQLVGTVVKDTIWIELNPGYADNNVSLRGTVLRETIRGEWVYTTFTGPRNHGTFVATKQ